MRERTGITPDLDKLSLIDRCGTAPAYGRYADPSSCQSYWQCGPDRRLSSKGCCPGGHRFEASSSQCVPDSSCPVTCELNKTHTCAGDHKQFITGCPYDVNPNNPSEFFYKFMPGSAFRCQPMQIMDVTACRCVRAEGLRSDCNATVDLNFEDNPMNDEDRVPRVSVGNGHAANFSGSDDIVLKILASSGFWTKYFQISLRLLVSSPVTPGPLTAVVTNAACNVEESVSITMDGTNFYFKIFQLNSNQSAEIAIAYSGRADPDGWFTLILLYRRIDAQFQFSGSVGSYTQAYTGDIPLTKYIDIRTCALHIGYGYRYSGLVGLVDDFQVWKCDPRAATPRLGG
ncbi:hypothetical protein BsWGS_08544 [Bradybaena similaris]